MHIRTIPAGGKLRRAVPNSSPIRKSVWAVGSGPVGGEGGGGAGVSAISVEVIVLGTTRRLPALARIVVSELSPVSADGLSAIALTLYNQCFNCMRVFPVPRTRPAPLIL